MVNCNYIFCINNKSILIDVKDMGIIPHSMLNFVSYIVVIVLYTESTENLTAQDDTVKVSLIIYSNFYLRLLLDRY